MAIYYVAKRYNEVNCKINKEKGKRNPGLGPEKKHNLPGGLFMNRGSVPQFIWNLVQLQAGPRGAVSDRIEMRVW